MGEQSENSVVLKSIRRDVTEDLKNMSLDSLNIDGEDIAVLKSMGISTLGDLLGASTTQLYDRLKTGILSRYWGIRNTVMDMGLLFTDDHAEYEELGISDDVALIPIRNLGLSTRVKNALTRKGQIYYLGDLLARDFESLVRIRNLGEDGIVEIKKYAHSLGYSLKDEDLLLNERKAEYKAKGIPMVQEELGLDGKTSGVLYRNGIYTLQDLINLGERVFELVGMGDVKAQKLREAIASKGIKLSTEVVFTKEEISEPIAVMPTEKIVKQLKQENTAIQLRISQKEELSAEYDRLIAERKELMAREQKLDKEIALKIAMLQSVDQKEEGVNYGRR